MAKFFYIKELDAVRGLAISMVLVWHYIGHPLTYNSGPISSVLSRILGFTWSGVELFFVLSGFLITNILIEHKHSSSLYSTFYIRRAARILPCYCLLLFSYYILTSFIISDPENDWPFLFSDPIPFWGYLVFIQNYFYAIQGSFSGQWLAPTWSLAVEEQFYLCLPILVRVVPVRKLGYVLAALFLCFSFLHLNLPQGVFKSALKFDFALLGALLAIGYRNNMLHTFSILENRYTPLVLLFLYLTLTFYIANYYWWLHSILLGIIYAGLIGSVLVNSKSMLLSFTSYSFFHWLGIRSFCVYLIHQPVHGLLSAFLLGSTSLPLLQTPNEFLVMFLALLTTLLISNWSLYYIENPIRSLVRNYKKY